MLAHQASSSFQITYDDTTTYEITVLDLVVGGLGSLLAGAALARLAYAALSRPR